MGGMTGSTFWLWFWFGLDTLAFSRRIPLLPIQNCYLSKSSLARLRKAMQRVTPNMSSLAPFQVVQKLRLMMLIEDVFHLTSSYLTSLSLNAPRSAQEVRYS